MLTTRVASHFSSLIDKCARELALDYSCFSFCSNPVDPGVHTPNGWNKENANPFPAVGCSCDMGTAVSRNN